MIETGIDVRVKIQDIVSSQLPGFILSESPLTDDFLKQFYVSQEFQGGPVDFASNLDQYLNVQNLTEEAIFGNYELTENISSEDNVIFVNTTKAFPNEWGLLKVDDEIMTYTGVTTNSFTGVVRGFSGITSYHDPANPSELIFESSEAAPHTAGSTVENLSTLFLKEFYEKLKFQFTPGFETIGVSTTINAGNWLRNARTFYQSKGSEESLRILFKVLFGVEPTIIDLEDYLIKSSTADYARRDYAVVIPVKGNPINLEGKTLFQSNDPSLFGAISEIEPFTRGGILYYRILFFVSPDEQEEEQKLFTLPARTRAQSNWNATLQTLTVDSTIGFSNNNKFSTADGTVFTYEDKSINQFFNVKTEDPTKVINITDEILDDITLVGNDDNGNEIVVRLTGVISGTEFDQQLILSDKGERIFVTEIGRQILSETALQNQAPSYDEIVANTFVYNTSVRFEVLEYNSSFFQLSVPYIDKSTLIIGDLVDILSRGTNNILLGDRRVDSVDSVNGSVTINDTAQLPTNLQIDIRRKQRFATSLNVPIDFGNNQVLANVNNLYDFRDVDSSFLVATNSLPAYEITADVVEISAEGVGPQNFEDFDSFTDRYSTFVFPAVVPFTTGDLVTYSVSEGSEPFMPEGNYFVEVLSDRRKVRFYLSPSFIRGSNFVNLRQVTNLGIHNLILTSQSERLIKTQKSLVKIPLSGIGQNITIENTPTEIEPGTIAVLTNGVNIKSFDSGDRFFIGPVINVNPASGGEGYDVIDPPELLVSDANVLVIEPVDFVVDPIADRAQIRPVLEGKLEKVLIDPQIFDIEEVFSITVTGGNSSGAILEPIIERTNRQIFFDSRQIKFGGGIDPINELLEFETPHNLPKGEPIIYNNRGNPSIGQAPAGGSNVNVEDLANGGTYFADPVNNTTIRIFNTLDDLNAGINTVGFTSDKTGFGIQSFDTLTKNRIVGVTIIDDGGTFTNRDLRFGPSNVSVIYNWIEYPNHGFNNGETVVYTTDIDPIDPLVDGDSYLILKIDDDKFRLCAIGPEDNENFNLDREEYIFFNDNGGPLSIQSLRYPDIEANVSVSFGSSITGEVIATPFIKGEITQIYVDKGGIYGSDIINFSRTPEIEILQGSRAALSPIINEGIIQGVTIQNKGLNYSDTPEVIVEDETGSGTGAILRAVVEDGEIIDVIILNGGVGYNDLLTRITVRDTGRNAILIPELRSLKVNSQERYGYENIVNGEYSIVSYDREIRDNVYEDDGTTHSPIIGWSNDGNPIYGPFGYEDPNNVDSPVIAVETSYLLDAQRVPFRPSLISYPAGFFVEDYYYEENDSINSLDRFNGRYARTPEFPNGVYAYFAGINTDTNSLARNPVFPYFIGPEFRDSPPSEQRVLDQNTFNFNQRIFRNTFPYAIGQPFAGSEFLDQSFIRDIQEVQVTDLNPGNVSSLQILSPGINYKVGDNIVFEDNEDNLSATVSQVQGKAISNISIDNLEYAPDITKLIKVNNERIRFYVYPEHELFDNDTVIISGLGTILTDVNGPQRISVRNTQMSLFSPIPTQPAGFITDIFVNSLVDNVEPESLISVGVGGTFETMEVLNVFPTNKALRVYRPIPYSELIGIGTPVLVNPNYFEVDQQVVDFDSRVDEVYYFNPFQTIAEGTEPGQGEVLNYQIGNINNEIYVENSRIYAPNHRFRAGERIEINTNGNDGFSLFANNGTIVVPPPGQETAELFVAKVYRDFIGVKTTTNGEQAFFEVRGSNNPRYSIRSLRFSENALVRRISADVTTIGFHELENSDTVDMTVKPTDNSGIGVNATIKVIWNDSTADLLFDPRSADSADIDIDTNLITSVDHAFELGDYVLYTSGDTPIRGIDANEKYYVLPFDSDRFFLAKTFDDVIPGNELVIDLTEAGSGIQSFSRVNPQALITRNNTVEFDVTDPSLFEKELKFFYDPELTEIFLNNGIDSEWAVSGVGTPGESTDARVFLNYSDNNPDILYYGLDVGGYISTADTGAQNNNSIEFRDSVLSGSKTVTVVGPTTFRYSVNDVPDKTIYGNINNILSYSTGSRTASGGIANFRIINSGDNFFKLPEFLAIESEEGTGGTLVGITSNIGRPANLNIVNPGWNYSADPTISPRGQVQPVVRFNDSDFVVDVDILTAGKGYQNTPQAVLVDSVTREEITNGSITVEVQSSSVSGVNIEVPPTGLSRNTHELFTINNSNGIPIIRIRGLNEQLGIVTYALQTPIFGFTQPPFEVGDEVFIENVYSTNNTLNNLNSSDNGYSFFTVIDFDEGPSRNEITVQYPPGANISFGSTFQNAISTIVNKKILPTFNVFQDTAIFVIGERLSVFNSLGTIIETDLIVTESNTNFFKFRGNYDIVVGDRVRGSVSGVIVTIESISNNEVRFLTSTISRVNNGWQNNIGFLNEEFQALPDNDYYQNLSYSVKSPVPFETLIGPLNKLAHPSGLKNFSDTSFETVSGVGFGSTSTTSITIDLLGLTDVAETPLRVDRVNYFDFARDANIFFEASNAIRLQSQTPNKRLTDYIEVQTNRALLHDDISSGFLDDDNVTETFPFVEFPVINQRIFARAVIQARNPFTDQIQFTENIFLFDSNDGFTLQKAEVSDILEFEESYGRATGAALPGSEYSIVYDIGRNYQQELDLDFKLYLNVLTGAAGPNLQPLELGFIQLSGLRRFVDNGNTEEIYSAGSTDSTDSIALYVQLNDTETGKPSYYEVYGFRLGDDTYQAIYNFDSENYGSYSDLTNDNFIVDIRNNELVVDFNNDGPSDRVELLTKSHRFRENFVGVQTYRFLAPDQNPGGEDSLFLTGTRSLGAVGDTFIDIVDVDAFRVQSIRSVVFIKDANDEYGSIQQLMSINKVELGLFDTFVTQYPFITEGTEELLVNNEVGIGTFGAFIDSSNPNNERFIVRFYPYSDLPSAPGTQLEVTGYHECFYRQLDIPNYDPTPLEYNGNEDSYFLERYIAPSGQRTNNRQFPLTYRGIPIYKKQFNPATQIIPAPGDNPALVVFSIREHFFSTAEELIYEPGTIDFGGEIAPIQIIVPGKGLNTPFDLPTQVFPVKRDLNRFSISTSFVDASNNIFAEVVDFGEGNGHSFEMVKKLEKSVITIDGVLQSPIAPSLLTYELDDVDVGVDTTFFSLVGFGTISFNDLLFVDDEYVVIENVGFGTTTAGPISGNGPFNLIEVERGVLGSIATDHQVGAALSLYRGSYNIVGSDIFFTQSPNGRGRIIINDSDIVETNSSYQGRTFLQQQYDEIQVFDDISPRFDGLTDNFELTVNSGGSPIAIDRPGSNILLINDVYQTPLTDNNPGSDGIPNNYFLQSFPAFGPGITTVVFTGIQSSNGDRIESEFDINQNQIPRGGLIVSLGSTPGLGYAPLRGASLRAFVDGNGSVVGVQKTDYIGVQTAVRWAEYDNRTGELVVSAVGPAVTGPIAISTAEYINTSGTLIVESSQSLSQLGITTNDIIVLADLEFTCNGYSGRIIGIETAEYSNITGLMIIEFTSNHGREAGQEVTLSELEFACPDGSGITTTIFPDGSSPFGDSFNVVSVQTPNTLTLNIGVGTIPHDYVGGGEARIGFTTTIFPDENDTFIINDILSDNVFTVNVGVSTIPHDYVDGGTLQKFNEFNFGPEGQNPKTIYLNGLGFDCNSGQNNQYIFPDKPGGFGFFGLVDRARFRTNVGISTIDHKYDPDRSRGVIGEYNVLNGGSGYRGTVDILVVDPNNVGSGASIIGVATDGGILDIQIIEPGIGYSDDIILDPPDPNYSNLPVIGAFRRGIGVTTITGVNLFVSCEVGSAGTSVGIASTLLQVNNFEITNQGYGFFPGDVVEVVGLVTAFGLSEPVSPFQLTVIDTFTDNFAAWSFGQLDYIDSIAELQDGERTRFPLQYEGDLLSFEKGSGEDSQSIDLDSIILIFVNTVLQEPGKSYVFEGGTSFEFFLPPRPEDRIDVYFYRGKEGLDSVVFDDINETVREGDDLQLRRNDALDGSARKTQNIRRVTEILSSDTVATPLYLSRGDLTSIDPRPLAWDKQKRDLFIIGEPKFKTRDSIEPIIRPVAKIIRTTNSLQRTLYLNTSELFTYENSFQVPPPQPDFRARIYQTIPSEFRAATAEAIVVGDEITSYVITDPGIGYPTAPTITVAPPVGFAQTQPDSRATAETVIDVNGSVISINPVGLGSFYNPSQPPIVLIDNEPINYEDLISVNVVQGFSGIITGITTTTGVPGVSTQGLRIQYKVPQGTVTGDLIAGDAIVLLNTTVGNGAIGIADTSTIADPVIVGVSTEFLDGVYVVTSNLGVGIRGEFEVQLTETDLTGVDNTFGEDIGNFSFGRFAQIDRNIEDSLNYNVDGTVYTPSMENYPTVVRTSEGLRNKGGLGRVI